MKKCLVVLSGWARKNNKGVWKTSGPAGMKLRVVAAKHLWEKDKTAFIITSGKKGGLAGIIDETLSKIMTRELISLGVDAKKIIQEPKSDNTHQQLANLPKIINKFGFDNIVIISNDWHLPRIRVMMKHLVPQLTNISRTKKISLMSAEEIMIKSNPIKWMPKIKKVRASKTYKNMIKSEYRGIQDILSNRYKSTH